MIRATNDGKYKVRLAIEGRWVKVTVDDKLLPLTINNYRARQIRYFWSAIIEKAIAQAHECTVRKEYKELNGGNEKIAFALITDKPVKVIKKADVRISKLREYLRKKYPTTTSIGASTGASSDGHALGIYKIDDDFVYLFEPNNLPKYCPSVKHKDLCPRNSIWNNALGRGCLKMSHAHFKRNIDSVTVCLFDYEEIESRNYIPADGYRIKPSGTCDTDEIVIGTYEAFEDYKKRRKKQIVFDIAKNYEKDNMTIEGDGLVLYRHSKNSDFSRDKPWGLCHNDKT